MGTGPSAERRQHPRHPLATGVEFFHGPSQREYPGRCVDVSEGGMFMYVPASVPVQPGHPIRLLLGRVSRPEFAVMADKPIDATVVRVERQRLIETGHLAVGVKFARA